MQTIFNLNSQDEISDAIRITSQQSNQNTSAITRNRPRASVLSGPNRLYDRARRIYFRARSNDYGVALNIG